MGKTYDGKKQWNETIAQSTGVRDGKKFKRKRFSGRTLKLSKAMKHVDEETRAMVRNARLDALEADNFGVEDLSGEDADNQDEMYVDDEDASTVRDKRRRKTKGIKSTNAKRAKVYKVKSLAQLVFEEFGSADQQDPTKPNYLTVAAKPSTLPPRSFCCVCGFFANYSCPRCGSRFCRVRCGDHHKESGCLKFGM